MKVNLFCHLFVYLQIVLFLTKHESTMNFCSPHRVFFFSAQTQNPIEVPHGLFVERGESVLTLAFTNSSYL